MKFWIILKIETWLAAITGYTLGCWEIYRYFDHKAAVTAAGQRYVTTNCIKTGTDGCASPVSVDYVADVVAPTVLVCAALLAIAVGGAVGIYWYLREALMEVELAKAT